MFLIRTRVRVNQLFLWHLSYTVLNTPNPLWDTHWNGVRSEWYLLYFTFSRRRGRKTTDTRKSRLFILLVTYCRSDNKMGLYFSLVPSTSLPVQSPEGGYQTRDPAWVSDLTVGSSYTSVTSVKMNRGESSLTFVRSTGPTWPSFLSYTLYLGS